jgi:hypothetical protein
MSREDVNGLVAPKEARELDRVWAEVHTGFSDRLKLDLISPRVSNRNSPPIRQMFDAIGDMVRGRDYRHSIEDL